MKQITLVLDNIRSAHNVGSMLRTVDGLGIKKVILCGITPYPRGSKHDSRLPHVANKAHTMIAKTALGAENTVSWRYHDTTQQALRELSKTHHIVCLEQTNDSIALDTFSNNPDIEKIALVVGTEVTGIDESVLALADTIIDIPMKGTKESFNVSVAAAIAMYELAKA